MEIIKMEERHREDFLKMNKKFYSSDAVSHMITEETMLRTFNEALSDNCFFDGYIFVEDGKTIGFSYISQYFESEVGGMCVMIIDLYFDESSRGKGCGTKFFNFIFDKYKTAKRFRLEVTKENEGAIKLYKRLGFEELPYKQMIIEKN